ncbi:MAG: hypothetical protein HY645_00330 [Acidobacteria bacterium]|nr:hypothetical protein [Acidobacteriota bacterium]
MIRFFLLSSFLVAFFTAVAVSDFGTSKADQVSSEATAACCDPGAPVPPPCCN